MAEFRKASETFWVAPQLAPEDFQRAADAGIRLIINNRAEGETPGQLSDAEARSLAERAGLAYAHIPVRMQTLSMAEIDATEAALQSADGPALAYCLSGARSMVLWALTQAKRGAAADGLIAVAGNAGYDLTPYRAFLERLNKP